MKGKLIRIVVFVAMVTAGGWSAWQLSAGRSALANSSASISIDEPNGVNDVVGQGDDFATTMFGDAWDMSESSDILPVNDLPNAVFSGGVLTYDTPTGVFGGVPLLFGHNSEIEVGRVGMLFPIDTNYYRWLSFRIKQPAGTNIMVNWHTTTLYMQESYTQNIPVTTSNWQTYVIDLETYPITWGSWSGQVKGLYIMSVAPNGTQVSIDWARLTPNNPTGNTQTIAWSGLSPTPSTIDFYLDTDLSGCNGVLIHTETSAGVSGSFAWGNSAGDKASPSNFAAGNYYVCAKVGSDFDYSSGPLTINQTPLVRITQPSFTSGDDYATDAGNAWDMSDDPDMPYLIGGTGFLQSGSAVVTVPGGTLDIQMYLNMPGWIPIDVTQYYYLTYRLKVDYPFRYYTDQGQFNRVYWGRDPLSETESQLMYAFPGWQTITLDLRSIPINNGGPSWNTANWDLLRIDPLTNRTGQSVTSYLDDVKLTGDERADAFADILWAMTDPDSVATTMSLYRDTDRSGFNGTLIATFPLSNGTQPASTHTDALNTSFQIASTAILTPTVYLPLVERNYRAPCTGACYTWYTSSVAAGSHYLYACVNDSYNQVCRYSETPLIISHP